MPRYAYDGKTKIVWCETIADPAAPTVAELTAGTDISQFVAKDGLQPNFSQNMVDSASIADTFNAQVVGSYGASMTLSLFRDDTTDTAWELIEYGTNGFLVVRRGMLQSEAFAASQDVEVYPAQFHEPVPQQSGQDTQVRFTAALAITDPPELKAVVAA